MCERFNTVSDVLFATASANLAAPASVIWLLPRLSSVSDVLFATARTMLATSASLG